MSRKSRGAQELTLEFCGRAALGIAGGRGPWQPKRWAIRPPYGAYFLL
jgi:hypothetical protein